VPDVRVHLGVDYKKRPGDSQQLGVGSRILTDAEGTWRFDSVPISKSYVHVSFDHPDFAPLRIRLPRMEFELGEDHPPSGRVELQPGLTVAGNVTDEVGKPIVGARVRTKFVNDIRETTTDEQGAYRLMGCEPRAARIVVSAKGRATDMRDVQVGPELQAVDFSLKPGGRIRIRVEDESGEGIPNARIFFQRWRGMWFEYFEFDHVSQYADDNGVWEWNEAPLDEFKADICPPHRMQLSEQSLVARDEEYVFRTPPILEVSGSVVDATTNEPIKAFRVIPGVKFSGSPSELHWMQDDSYEAADGNYRINFTRSYPSHWVRIEAEGYETAVSRALKSNEGDVDLDFALQPRTKTAH